MQLLALALHFLNWLVVLTTQNSAAFISGKGSADLNNDYDNKKSEYKMKFAVTNKKNFSKEKIKRAQFLYKGKSVVAGDALELDEKSPLAKQLLAQDKIETAEKSKAKVELEK